MVFIVLPGMVLGGTTQIMIVIKKLGNGVGDSGFLTFGENVPGGVLLVHQSSVYNRPQEATTSIALASTFIPGVKIEDGELVAITPAPATT